MTFTVRGRVMPSWGGHSRAVRVHNEPDFLAWFEAEGVTTQILFEPDEDGQKRPSIYLGDKMAAQVNDGDIVDLQVESHDTVLGRNLRLIEIYRVS